MKLSSGYRIDYRSARVVDGRWVATLHVAWWRVLLIRLFGKRGA